MSITSVFGKSEAEQRAHDARIEAEDRMMEIHPLEGKDLSFHARADGQRNMVLLTRMRDGHAKLSRQINNVFLAVLIIGAALLIKGVTLNDVLTRLGIPHAP